MSQNPPPERIAGSLAALGKRIALARRARTMTQRELAVLADVGTSSVAALEKGHPGVALGTMVRLLDAMGLLSELEHLLVPERDQALTQFALALLAERR